MRNIYSSRARPRTPLLDRLALLSALALAGVVSLDLVAYRWLGDADRVAVSAITETAAAGD